MVLLLSSNPGTAGEGVESYPFPEEDLACWTTDFGDSFDGLEVFAFFHVPFHTRIGGVYILAMEFAS